MHEVELFIGLLVAVVLVALAARRLRRIPHAVALVVGGIAVGLLPFAPEVSLDPDVILLVFLPPILYPSAYRFAGEDIRGSLRPIAFLSIGLVLATMAAIAVVAHLVAGIPWGPAFVLGAILAPTDPVAASAVIRASGAPQRLTTILEGESLINDATALSSLRIAIAAVGGAFSVGGALGDFVLIAFGGAAVGAALGWLTSLLRSRIDDLELESAVAVLLAYGAFVLAERLGVSGILATVLAGWVMGRRGDVVSAETRLGGASFWGVAQFLAESILFLLVGLAFAQSLDDPATRPALEVTGITALVVVTTIGIRMAWMFTVPYLAGLWDSGTRGFGALTAASERVVLGFAGLRGAVSVAAALTIPPTVAGGAPFPERSTVIAVAFGAIVALIIIPALGLGRVLRAVGLQGAGDAAEREARARAALADAALGRAEEIAAEEDLPEELMARVRERYEWRIQRYGNEGNDRTRASDDRVETYRRLREATLGAQRRELAELQARGEVSGEVLRTLERDLDLEEARIR